MRGGAGDKSSGCDPRNKRTHAGIRPGHSVVKTTGAGKFLPFSLTATELRCSEDARERFLLSRVFDFADSPRVYVLAGPMSEKCKLEPVSHRATI